MRHRKTINHLSRTSAHRKAMLANMASSLIMHKRINTTLAKAKALRMYVEPILTKSKSDSTHSRRMVFSYLQNKEAVSELFREVSQKIAGRPGGYTRIIKLGNRLGDNAEMCLIELVDYNENMLREKEAEKKSSRRTTRRGRKSAQPGGEAVASAETAAVAKEAKAAREVKETESVKEEPKAAPVAEAEETTEIQAEMAADEAPAAEEDASAGEAEDKKDA